MLDTEDLNISGEEFNLSDIELDINEEISKSTSSITTSLQTTSNKANNKLSPVWKFIYEKVKPDETTIVHNCNIGLNQSHKLLTTKPYGKGEAQRLEEYNISLLNFVIDIQASFAIVESPWFAK
ncbi:22139_t:CDS:2 [Dentiscutata erythropus]|uniref:22139_t:CDS:1 n=1 Tax=Dentiscutata erythropus TaxID=1348616 RepID=A0A9N9EC48_9GLOM|nr:22139_t:CDS:2 [Dentiscutata erythropus]